MALPHCLCPVESVQAIVFYRSLPTEPERHHGSVNARSIAGTETALDPRSSRAKANGTTYVRERGSSPETASRRRLHASAERRVRHPEMELQSCAHRHYQRDPEATTIPAELPPATPAMLVAHASPQRHREAPYPRVRSRPQSGGHRSPSVKVLRGRGLAGETLNVATSTLQSQLEPIPSPSRRCSSPEAASVHGVHRRMPHREASP